MLKNIKCVRCHSSRIIRFIDGFGDRRIYCRSCSKSFLLGDLNRFKQQKTLLAANS